MLGIIGTFLYVIMCVVNYDVNHPGKFMPPKRYLAGALFFVFLSAIIPSKETIYLIAGSESAEFVVTSEEGKEILSDIKDVIRAQLVQLKQPKE